MVNRARLESSRTEIYPELRRTEIYPEPVEPRFILSPLNRDLS